MPYIHNIFAYMLPVIGGNRVTPNTSSKSMLVQGVYGTAFYIGQDCFITAGHVVKAAAEKEIFGIGYRRSDLSMRTAAASDYEIFEALDVGFIKAHVPIAEALTWNLDVLRLLTDVRALGYPYALDLEQARVDLRAFKGYIVSMRPFLNLETHPFIYELSFQAHRGLSGAPLFTWEDVPQIAGLVIGNATTEINILSSRERLSEGTETILERFEAFHVGIALQTNTLISITSQMLGGTLEDHLRRSSPIQESA